MKEYRCDICRKSVSGHGLYGVTVEYPLFWFRFDDTIEVCKDCRARIVGFIKQMEKEADDGKRIGEEAEE